MNSPSRPVVVGVDGSKPSLAALDWAIGEALARDRYLRIVHSFTLPLLRLALEAASHGPPDGGFRAAAEQILDEAVRHAWEEAPDLMVEGRLHDGIPSAVLLAEAADAELVVLGSRGIGGFIGLLVGSVSAQVATHASCPVVVVRAPRLDTSEDSTYDRVLVGVDGGMSALAGLGFAFEEAERLGTGLTAIHCTRTPVTATGRSGGRLADNLQAESERQMLAEAVGPWSEKHPNVDVVQLLVTGRPAATLAAASRGGRLLVVGARGLGGFSGLRLGSISHQMLHHAACPVAVVRRDR